MQVKLSRSEVVAFPATEAAGVLASMSVLQKEALPRGLFGKTEFGRVAWDCLLMYSYLQR